MASKLTYVATLSERTTRFLEVVAELRESTQQWQSLDYSNTMGSGETFNISGDQPLTKDDVTGVMVTLDALLALLSQGHFTNLYKLKR